MKNLITAGLVVVKDRKLLLAFSNNKKAFYLPGGKTDEGESTATALRREVLEELNIQLAPEKVQYYTHIEAPAFGEKDLLMQQDCFFYDLQETPVPAAEIGDLRYFDTASYRLEPQQVPGVILIMKRLVADGLID